jgi:NADH:ubiquinone oxidoreductase subunit 3 (subunit A)
LNSLKSAVKGRRVVVVVVVVVVVAAAAVAVAVAAAAVGRNMAAQDVEAPYKHKKA